MSIIGSINKKNQELRSKLISSKEGVFSDNNMTIPRAVAMDTIQEDEILKSMVMELSIPQNTSQISQENFENNLEQTIIIGEMDEGTIFDDFNQ